MIEILLLSQLGTPPHLTWPLHFAVAYDDVRVVFKENTFGSYARNSDLLGALTAVFGAHLSFLIIHVDVSREPNPKNLEEDSRGSTY